MTQEELSEQGTLPPNFGMKSSRDGFRLALVLTPGPLEPISVAGKVVVWDEVRIG